ncbi:MAG: lipid-A-disaccharide synthase [Acidobacteriota bacterium]
MTATQQARGEALAPQRVGAAEQDVLVVAGETSGDLHAARLLSALAERRGGGDLRFFGLGSHQLRAAGCECLYDSEEISVVGIVEVLKIYRRARQIFDGLLAEVDRRGARTALLVDFPEFNMRLARELRRRGVRVLYYISPQIWAWRQGRVRAIERDVDLMLVLFPFEVDFYREHAVEAEWVGHPLVDEVPEQPQLWDGLEEADAERAGSGGPDPQDEITVSLLPGSRRSEVRALLPAMLSAVEHLAAAGRRLRVQLIQAPSIRDDFLDEVMAGSAVLQEPPERVRENRFDAVSRSHIALCASGTATLEVALLRTPMVVLYRLKWMSYWLGRLLVKLPHFCMVNLVLGRRAVPELLQAETRGERVAEEMGKVLDDPARRAAMRRDLAELRRALGESGASARAAAAVDRHLGPPARSAEGALAHGGAGEAEA